MWWAADPPPTVWQAWLPATIVAVFTALVAAGGTVWVKRMNRRLDEATTVKTEAETRKTAAEAEATQVTTARSLVAEIRLLMVDQRQTYEGQIDSVRAQHGHDMKTMAERLSRIERTVADHRRWDVAATEILRTVSPDFMEPPPLSFD